MQGVFGAGHLGGFHPVDGLFETVHRGMPLAVHVFRQVQDKMKLGVANLQRTGPIACEPASASSRGCVRRCDPLVSCSKISASTKQQANAHNRQ